MKLTLRSAFTLIELLVVITIIAILATGGTTVYTSQLQKARDANRMADLQKIKSGLEQFNADFTKYPQASVSVAAPAAAAIASGDTGILQSSFLGYLGGSKIVDVKHNQAGCVSTVAGAPNWCGYVYVTGDLDGITRGFFEISTAFENKTNQLNKAAVGKDNPGTDPDRYEISSTAATAQILVGVQRTSIAAVPVWLNGAVAAIPNTASLTNVSIMGFR